MISKPKATSTDVASAAISLQALMRHQNQRSTSTGPMPAPMAQTKSQARPMLVRLKATITAKIIIRPTQTFAARTVSFSEASGRQKRR